MNVCWKVGRGETHLRQRSFENTWNVKSLLLSERLLQSSAAQHLWELFFVVVVSCASATLYNLISMQPLSLAFMLTSKVTVYPDVCFRYLRHLASRASHSKARKKRPGDEVARAHFQSLAVITLTSLFDLKSRIQKNLLGPCQSA